MNDSQRHKGYDSREEQEQRRREGEEYNRYEMEADQGNEDAGRPGVGSASTADPRARPDSLPESGASTADPRARPDSLPESGAGAAAPVGVGWRPATPPGAPPDAQATSTPADKRGSTGMFSKTKIVGYVRGLNCQMAQDKQVYSFRVETFDARGNRLPPITVQMKGIGFVGSLNEGDQVEISKKPRPGKVIKVARLRNLTAGSTFKVQRHPFYVRILAVPMSLIGWIITAAFVVGFFALIWIIISSL